MGTKRVQVPQDSGSIEIQSVNLGYVLDKKFTVHDGVIEVDENQVAAVLKAIDGSSVIEDAAPKSPVANQNTDKTEKK